MARRRGASSRRQRISANKWAVWSLHVDSQRTSACGHTLPNIKTSRCFRVAGDQEPGGTVIDGTDWHISSGGTPSPSRWYWRLGASSRQQTRGKLFPVLHAHAKLLVAQLTHIDASELDAPSVLRQTIHDQIRSDVVRYGIDTLARTRLRRDHRRQLASTGFGYL